MGQQITLSNQLMNEEYMYEISLTEGSDRVCELCFCQSDHRAYNHAIFKIILIARFNCHLEHKYMLYFQLDYICLGHN